MKQLLLISLISLSLTWSGSAKDYHASVFGIRSDGITLNTGSIQKAIDLIHEQGGGNLIFSVGRYLTGSIQLKSKVRLELREGAVLLGTTSIHDYLGQGPSSALIYAQGQEEIGVFGKGVIQGQGPALRTQYLAQEQKGHLSSLLGPPALLAFVDCKKVQIQGLHLVQPAGKALRFAACQDLSLEGLALQGLDPNQGPALEFNASKNMVLRQVFLDSNETRLGNDGTCEGLVLDRAINAAGKALSLK